MCGFEGMYHKPQKSNKEINKYLKCASGSVVEYRLAKARVAGSNPVSRSEEPDSLSGFLLYTDIEDLERWGKDD